MNSETQNLISLGRMVELHHCKCVELHDAIFKLGLTPRLTLNGVRYFDERDAAAVFGYLRSGCKPTAPAQPEVGQ